MKLMIASDIHGSAFYCKQLIEAYKQEQPDKLLLLGDLLYHGPRNDLPKDYAPKQVIEMLNAISNQLICVRGNCEAEVDQMVLNFPVLSESCILYIDGQTIYATHGHINSPANPPKLHEGTEKVDYTVYIWYNVSIKYRRCFYDRTTAEIDAKSIHGNI